VSQETMAMMAEHRVYFDPTFISLVQRIESAGDTHLPDRIVSNLRQTVARGQDVYAWAKQCDVPIAFGTDLWGPEAQRSQLREFEMRVGLDSPARIIRSATATNAELLMQEGKLGVIAPGAYADLLVVDGDPLADLRVLTDPQRNLKVIMKDGVLYKNELS
jgi:imidazolonepropionase-like amidohydrolase